MTNFAILLLVLLGMTAPLALLAWRARAFPRVRLAVAALVPAVLSLGVIAWWPILWLVVVADLVLWGVVIYDLLSLPARGAISFERHLGRVASLRKPHRAELMVGNTSRQSLKLWVRDGVVEELGPSPEEFELSLDPRSRVTLQYELRPRRRGAFQIAGVHVRFASRFWFWQRVLVYPLPAVVHVYPDMKQLGQYAVLARTNRLSLLGVRRTRRIGQDNEFERLRDFTRDDNYKHLDWRATARRLKLTVKDYQTAQSQRIIFLIDSGRMMTNEAAGLSLLDHSLNAMLMLSYVALRQGDSVGLISFSDEVHEFVPPRSGMRQMNRLLHSSFDRFPRLVESRYDLAFRYLASHCRKRSLVVLVTSVIDEINSGQIERYLANLVGRHLPLGVLLRDHRMFEPLETEFPTGKQLWRAAAAADILNWRHQVLSDLQSKGVLVLDVFPEAMTAPMINRYLEVKARHLL
ncbi:MAG: DUF58 domain-containing protein [Planctomycetota bacterium]